MKVQWVLSMKFSGCYQENPVGARSASDLRCVRSYVMTITVDRVGELKDLMIESLWAFVLA